jgi:hypothetical protein
MRERVEGAGGTLRTGHRETGAAGAGVGYVVDAAVPLGAAPAADGPGPASVRRDAEPDGSGGDA